MMTLYEVLDLAGDEEKLQKWLRSYGVLDCKPTKCMKCGSKVKDCVHLGKPCGLGLGVAVMEHIRDGHFQ